MLEVEVLADCNLIITARENNEFRSGREEVCVVALWSVVLRGSAWKLFAR